MSEPQTPNIRVRTGESGPFLDWLYWLRNLSYFAGFKRIWTAQQTGSPITVPDESAETPGTEVLSQDIEWTADDYAIADQLHYMVLARFVFNTAPAPGAYPGVLDCNLNVTPFGGALATVHTWVSFTSPATNGPGFDTKGQSFGAWLMQFGKFPVFAVGTNRISLGIGNPGTGADIYAQNTELVVAELACPPGMLSTP